MFFSILWEKWIAFCLTDIGIFVKDNYLMRALLHIVYFTK